MEPEKARSVIEACLRHGLAGRGGDDFPLRRSRTLQEYFAAEALLKRCAAGTGRRRAEASTACRSLLDRQAQRRLSLLLRTGGWRPLYSLRGFSEVADALAAAVVRVNPWAACGARRKVARSCEKTREAHCRTLGQAVRV
jgi:hypothetical protein